MVRALRIYSETLPLAEVTAKGTLALLARHPFELVLAVRPWQLEALPDVALALRDHGIGLSVWPMLGDGEGRWASAANAGAFAALLRRTVDDLAARRVLPREVLLDLEPPFSHARALADGELSALSPRHPPGFGTASGELARAVADLHAHGVASAAAVWPLVALDAEGETAWQSLLGTPVDALGLGRVSVMMYTSILEGWSRGALRRHHTEALLAAATARVTQRWGARGGVSVGCVGVGALEDEPTYRDPSELAADVTTVRAGGCDDLSLFDLGGVLARPPAEAWLDAFAAGHEGRPLPSSLRIGAARRLARVATWALARRRR